MEKILGNIFSLDDCVNPILGVNEEEIELVRSFDQENHTARDGTQSVISEMMSEKNEDYMDNVNSFDEEQFSSTKSPCSVGIYATPSSMFHMLQVVLHRCLWPCLL